MAVYTILKFPFFSPFVFPQQTGYKLLLKLFIRKRKHHFVNHGGPIQVIFINSIRKNDTNGAIIQKQINKRCQVQCFVKESLINNSR